jgi:hypothetical protein
MTPWAAVAKVSTMNGRHILYNAGYVVSLIRES